MSEKHRLRIVVVDDSLIYRTVVRNVLATIPEAEVVGVAKDGRVALEKVRLLQPDLLTLDLEMPELDGLGVLKQLQEDKSQTAAIMLSSFSERAALTTTQALRLGAFDFVRKPAGDNVAESHEQLRDELARKLRAFSASRRGPSESVKAVTGFEAATEPAGSSTTVSPTRTEVVAIGISTGGPAALAKVLPALPPDVPWPIIIVQHMPPLFTRSLAEDLGRLCKLKVAEAVDGQPVLPGEVLIAPGGRQMKVTRTELGDVVRLTNDPPERNCRPSVDYLFRSLAEGYGSRTLAVMMTGMGDDGSVGCRLLKRKGARIICQDEESCVVFGMPKAPIEERLADCITPLDGIARQIIRLASRGESVCP